MPCDTIQTSTINLGADKRDAALLTKALAALGYERVQQLDGGRVNFGDAYNGGFIHADGRVELRGAATRMNANDIKRAYSVEAVKLASAKFGWSLKQTSADKFVAQRRF